MKKDIASIVNLIKKAHTVLSSDVLKAIEAARRKESNRLASLQLKNILENAALAKRLKVPMCQDTGIPCFYVKLGKCADAKAVEKAITIATRKASAILPLRPNVVDPLNRKNTGSTGEKVPIINWEFAGGKKTEIIYFPKGAGSENMSAQIMLPPSKGVKGVKDFVVETVKSAGGNPCPPIIVGVGIGGSFDLSSKLAKQALLRPLDSSNKRKDIARLEKELLNAINKLGIGAMGVGGKTTCLKVSVEYASCHTASLPVAVNIECWAHRCVKMVV